MTSNLKGSFLGLITAVVLLGGSRLNFAAESPQARPLVILIGPPLSGKTSFVTTIQRNYGIPGISIEDLIVDHAAELRNTESPA